MLWLSNETWEIFGLKNKFFIFYLVQLRVFLVFLEKIILYLWVHQKQSSTAQTRLKVISYILCYFWYLIFDMSGYYADTDADCQVVTKFWWFCLKYFSYFSRFSHFIFALLTAAVPWSSTASSVLTELCSINNTSSVTGGSMWTVLWWVSHYIWIIKFNILWIKCLSSNQS